MNEEQALLLKSKKVAELREIAKAFGISNADDLKKSEIIALLVPEGVRVSKPKETMRVKAAKTEAAVPAETDASLLSEAPDFLIADGAFSKKNGALQFVRAESITPDKPASGEGAAFFREDPWGEALSAEDAPRFAPPVTEPAFARSFGRKVYASDSGEERGTRVYAPTEDRPEVEGILEVTDQGYGFLRFNNYRSSEKDVYVSQIQIRRFNLKDGDKVKGIIRKPDADEKFGAILFIREINDEEPGIAMRRAPFEQLTPLYPTDPLPLIDSGSDVLDSIDREAPLAKGQRILLAGSPRSGKTRIMRCLSSYWAEHNPELNQLYLAVGERPEDITELRRTLLCDVIASSFDETPQQQIKLAELALERARRLAEHKKDVVLFIDSMTRLVHAYNIATPASGKMLAGSLDPGCLSRPRGYLASACKLEEGGSVTVISSFVTDNGSRMDEMILQAFRGVVNNSIWLVDNSDERHFIEGAHIHGLQ